MREMLLIKILLSWRSSAPLLTFMIGCLIATCCAGRYLPMTYLKATSTLFMVGSPLWILTQPRSWRSSHALLNSFYRQCKGLLSHHRSYILFTNKSRMPWASNSVFTCRRQSRILSFIKTINAKNGSSRMRHLCYNINRSSKQKASCILTMRALQTITHRGKLRSFLLPTWILTWLNLMRFNTKSSKTLIHAAWLSNIIIFRLTLIIAPTQRLRYSKHRWRRSLNSGCSSL